MMKMPFSRDLIDERDASYKSGKWKLVVAACDKIIKRDIDPSERTHFIKGVALYCLNDYRGAIDAFNRCFSIESKFYKALAFDFLGDHDTSLKIFLFVLASGPPEHIKEISERNVLKLSLIENNIDRIMEMRPCYRKDIDKEDHIGRTLLYIAVENSCAAAAATLADLDADPFRRNRWSESPFLLAVKNGEHRIIKIFIAKCAAKYGGVRDEKYLHSWVQNNESLLEDLTGRSGYLHCLEATRPAPNAEKPM